LSLPDVATLPAVWVPSLILQPLVENAIVHGLTGHDGEVSIELDVSIEGETLVVRLTNSIAAQGGGDRPGPTGSGIGLRNVRERLAVHFGDRSEFAAGPDEARRWRVQMRLPLLRLE
jgi:LytS/YehU family sensor histidine kinase